MAKKYQAPIVKKAFEILKIISKNRNGLRISEISARLDISKSTVHGIIAALEEQGAIVRHSDSKRFTTGPTLIELGHRTQERIDLKKIARPILEELMEACEESVFLGIRNDGHVTVIDIVESKKDFKITSPVGTEIPLMAGAIGKVFLSQLSEKEAGAYLRSMNLPQYTDKSLSSPEDYLKELSRVRENGYATDDEEYISGVRAVAAPVTGCPDTMAAVWVVGFKAGLGAERMKLLIRQTCNACAKIRQKLLK